MSLFIVEGRDRHRREILPRSMLLIHKHQMPFEKFKTITGWTLIRNNVFWTLGGKKEETSGCKLGIIDGPESSRQ